MSTPAQYRFLPPAMADRMKSFGLTVRTPIQGLIQGLHRSPDFGSSVEFAEYREYTHGDPPNLIDWSVYAKSDRYMIRRFQDETNLHAHILLDCSASLNYGNAAGMTKLDYARYIAAGFLFVLVNQGDTGSLMTFQNGITESFPPAMSIEGLRPLLLGLENVKPSGIGDIEKSLHEAANRITSKSLIIVISDFLQNPKNVENGIKHLRHNGHEVTAYHIFDAAELNPPQRGLVELEDLESGRKLLVNFDEIMETFKKSVRNHLDQIRNACQSCGADYNIVDTKIPPEEAILKRATPV